MSKFYLKCFSVCLFLLVGVTAKSYALGFLFDTYFQKDQARIRVKVSITEDDCWSCDDDDLTNSRLFVNVNGGTINLMQGASRGNAGGWWRDSRVSIGGEYWDGAHLCRDYFIQIPTDWFGKGLTVGFDYTWNDSDDRAGTRYSNQNIPTIDGAGFNFWSTGQLNDVVVKWNKPNLNGYPEWGISYDVYRNNSYLGTTSSQEWTDHGAVKGTKYNYKVKTRLTTAGNSVIESYSGDVTAWSNMKVETTNAQLFFCDNGIWVDWKNKPVLDGTWTYRVVRATNNQFTANFKEIIIDNKDEWHVKDQSDLEYNETYFYQVRVYRDGAEIQPLRSNTRQITAANLKPAVPAVNLALNGIHHRLSWIYDCLNNDKFQLIRKVYQTGILQEESTINLAKDIREWSDTRLKSCYTYEYQLIAINRYTQSEGNVITRTVTDNITDAFVITDAEKLDPENNFYNHDFKFKASKGFFTNYIQLQWEAKYPSRIQNYHIFRRIAGSGTPYELIRVEGSSATLFIDEYTEANTIYEYRIQGSAPCDGITLKTDYAVALGFRSPYGTITGRVAFEGGQGVENVMVRARNTEGTVGKAIKFKDQSASIGFVSSKVFWPGTNGWGLDAWLRPENINQDYVLYDQYEAGKGLKLSYTNGRFVLQSGAEQSSIDAKVLFRNNEYTHLSVSLTSANDVNWVVNDSVFAVQKLNSAFVKADDENLPLIIGNSRSKNQGFVGTLDEVRVWTVAHDGKELERDYSRFMVGGETGLTAYLRFDEGFSANGFDVSKSGRKFNENHSKISGNFEWSTVVPSESQLANVAFTDAKGDYKMTNIQFRGAGEIYEITPMLGIHKFEASSMTLFIGDGALTHNGKDFKDVSAFRMYGTVKYKGTQFPVQGVKVMVDGKQVLNSNNEPVSSDANGNYELLVPIGKHNVTFSKPGHFFANPAFPSRGLHDFQENLRGGYNLIDTTTVMVRGRVAGGQVEEAKSLGVRLSANNLGRAKIILRPEKEAALDSIDVTKRTLEIVTDEQYGEFVARIIPERFIVQSVRTLNRRKSTNDYYDFGDQKILDLTSPVDGYSWEYKYDTKVTTKKVDSAAYHFKRQFILHSDAKYTINEGEPIGESTYKVGDKTINLVKADKSLLFGAPVFKMNAEYEYPIHFYEEYENADKEESDATRFTRVPITSAEVRVTNSLKQGNQDESFELNDSKGKLNYKFNATIPNLNGDYLKGLQLAIKVGDYPVKAFPAVKGYILGSVSTGSGFVTKGPSVVEFVLRDPPGTGSYSYLSKGSSMSKTMSLSETSSRSEGFNVAASLGLAFTTSTGVGVEVELENEFINDIGGGETVSRGATKEGEFVETIDIAESWETSSSPDFVGSKGDLFVGSAMNFIIGKTETFELVEWTDEFEKFGFARTDLIEIDGKNYALIRRQGIAAAQNNFGTRFMYTKFHIEEKLIPEIKALRNSLFTNAKTKAYYTSKLAVDHKNYGADNYDKKAFGASAWVLPKEGASSIRKVGGPSYDFNPPRAGYIDSVYMYNQQIALWEKALRDNEANKVISRQNAKQSNNVSFDGGTNYTWDKTMTNEWSTTNTIEIASESSLETALGYKINSFGIVLETSTTWGTSKTRSDGSGGSNSLNFGYVLSDGDEGDYYSVDVIDPSDLKFQTKTGKTTDWAEYYKYQENGSQTNNGFFSPMFFTRGGQSMCPYQGEEKTKYYQPGEILNAATMRREVPSIAVEQAVVSNVPETNAAVFTMKLENLSETEADDTWLGVQVLDGTNPHGAIVSIDGASANKAFHVPFGEVLKKTLTIKKGPGAIYDYEKIGIILHSLCERDDVADTVYISAHFDPACTIVDMKKPLDNWLANVESNGKVEVEMTGYDVNLASFKSIELQYKSTASNTWATLHTFYNKEADYDAELAKDKNAAISKINGKPTIVYDWIVTDLPDRNYEMRAKSLCTDGSINYSQVRTGIKDATPPLVFGAPQPADGILSPNDEIMIQFGEQIEGGLVTKNDILIKGVLNGSKRAHGAFQKFDGKESFAKIPVGLSLNQRSFTVEFWARPQSNATDHVVFSQGEGAETLNIGFNASGKLYAEWNGQERITSTKTMDADTWAHYAVSYDLATKKVNMYANDQQLAEKEQVNEFTGLGSISLGQTTAATAKYHGDLYGLNVWDIYRSRDEVYAGQSKKLNGSERGLVGSWAMNELGGKILKDAARALHAQTTATWMTEPASSAINLTGNGYVQVPAAHAPITKNTDFTLELWVKAGSAAKESTIFSAYQDNTDMKWSLDFDGKGGLFLKNNELLFKGIDNNILDDQWHHIAMVTDRRGNLSFYLDGELKNSRKADVLTKLASASLYLGTHYENKENNGNLISSFTQNFTGKLDEFRLWNSARTAEQIKRSMHIKQAATLPDLQIYLPFETYVDNSGVMLSSNSDKDLSGKSTSVAVFNNASYTTISPLIDRPQPEQSVDFNFVVNGDKVLITLNETPALVEKTILDVSVRGIMDKHNNVMQGVRTWSVFVDKNQVKWNDTNRKFEKELYKPMSFEVQIVNQGGSQEKYSLEGMPAWLTASPAAGTIEPNSRKTITFTVEESLNIGNYKNDLFLRTNFGYDEKLTLDLKVFAPGPDWKVNAANFDKSMSVIAQIKINDKFSINPDDKVAAFVNGEVRGVAQVKYVAGYDKYLLFMDVYGKVNELEKVYFNIWNASAGVVHTNVTPAELVFRDGEVYGAPSNPLVLTATDEVYQNIALKQGWNWLSFNVNVKNTTLDKLIDPAILDKSSVFMDQQWTADHSMGSWAPPGKQVNNTASYLLRVSADANLRIKGGMLNPANEQITLKKGWNWVGYTPQVSMPVKDALAGVKLQSGDIIKSQTGFSIYDEYMGWIGSLSYLKIGEGYRIKSSATGDVKFVFPKASINSGATTIASVKGSAKTLAAAAKEDNRQFTVFAEKPSAYRYNMNMIAAIEGLTVREGTVIKALNSKGEQAGWGSVIMVEGKPVFFVTLNSDNQNELVTFSYRDAKGNLISTLKESVVFKSDNIAGTLTEPFMFTTDKVLDKLEATVQLIAYPNPFETEVTLKWKNDPSQNTVIEVLDMSGRLVRVLVNAKLPEENGVFVWDARNEASLIPGMYIVRLTQGKHKETIKVIKK
ncbi:LamG-like jellyroll fold domain-containing protein [Desertivirga brevis]|uniref:LamG-like jellyroll fold domain-containing protein n=1 Tax=Desertivirga brevis TaxID=2810310 RepID=UPI001A9597C9|nr:LamG-like jellyroll fold domain-containing protein [Pedobacter sp. SYSU D00873]